MQHHFDSQSDNGTPSDISFFYEKSVKKERVPGIGIKEKEEGRKKEK